MAVELLQPDDDGAVAAHPLSWEVAFTEAGQCVTPQDLSSSVVWSSEEGASAIFAGDDPDAGDWWYRTYIDAGASASRWLELNGSAVMQVWLDGRPALQSDNMFLVHEIDVGQGRSIVHVVFRSLEAHLATRRPRPRWRTNLVENQQLRWVRTTLLGRMPAWSAERRRAGPWRPTLLHAANGFRVVHASVRGEVSGREPHVRVDASVESLAAPDAAVTDAWLLIGGRRCPLHFERSESLTSIRGRVAVAGLDLWYPHTHGRPDLHDYELWIESGSQRRRVLRGRIGFRHVVLDAEDGGVTFSVNGTRVFCRGACWTVPAPHRSDRDAELRRALTLARDAGANMIRLGGTMVYEDERFYELCDELGLMVWQDFMFANMDYPHEDAAFRASVIAEVTQQARRLSCHPCVAVFCGNSEVEQQAVMMGIEASAAKSPLFYETIPGVLASLEIYTPYVAASPSGDGLPFHTNSISHYFGVGAYRRALSDQGLRSVAFATECLGFSNVPSSESTTRDFGSAHPSTRSPAWRAGVPRDGGVGWDFEDIRDHYLTTLFGVDPVELRFSDNERYLELSRVVTGEIVSRVFSVWRGARSRCTGGLIWFFSDLIAGPGWGVLDHRGEPKPVYYYLKRCWAPLCVLLEDRGLDGPFAQVVNDTAAEVIATLELVAFHGGEVEIARAEKSLTIAARSRIEIGVDQTFDRFYDLTRSYRFGPDPSAAVSARLLDAAGTELSSTMFVPGLLPRKPATLHAFAEADAAGRFRLQVSCDHLAQAVQIVAAGYRPSDNYFHLLPGVARSVYLEPIGTEVGPPKGLVTACNSSKSARIRT